MASPWQNGIDLDWLDIRLVLARQASPGHQLKIMFPTISSVREVRCVRQLLLEVQAGLRSAGIPFDEMVKTGIMVEVPSAVMVADRLARAVDFFSIGTKI